MIYSESVVRLSPEYGDERIQSLQVSLPCTSSSILEGLYPLLLIPFKLHWLVAKLIHYMHFIWHQIAAGATHRSHKHAATPARWKVCFDLYRLACDLLHQAHGPITTANVELILVHKPTIAYTSQN